MVTFDKNSKYKDFPKFRDKKDIYDAIDAKYDAARGKQYEAEMQQGDLASNDGGQGTFKNPPSSFNPTPYFSTNPSFNSNISSEDYKSDAKTRLEEVADRMNSDVPELTFGVGRQQKFHNLKVDYLNESKGSRDDLPDIYLSNDDMKTVMEDIKLKDVDQYMLDGDPMHDGYEVYENSLEHFSEKGLDNHFDTEGYRYWLEDQKVKVGFDKSTVREIDNRIEIEDERLETLKDSYVEDDLDVDRDDIDSDMYERLVNGLSIDEATPKADLYVDSVENPDIRLRLESIADELLMEDNKVQGYENYGHAGNLPNEELYSDNKALLFDKYQKKGEPDLYLTNDELRDVENTRLLRLSQEYMDSNGNIRNDGEGHDTYDDKMNDFTNKALDNAGKGYNNIPDNKSDGYYNKVEVSTNLQRGMDEALLRADLDLYDELREERDALLVDIDSYGDIDGDTPNIGKDNTLYDDGDPNKYRDKASGSTRDFDSTLYDDGEPNKYRDKASGSTRDFDNTLYDDGSPNKYRDKASGFKTLEEQGYNRYPGSISQFDNVLSEEDKLAQSKNDSDMIDSFTKDSSMSRSKPKKGMLYGGHVPEVYEATNKNSEAIRKATSLDEGAGFDADYESSVNKLEDEYVNTSPPEPYFEEEIEDDGPEM